MYEVSGELIVTLTLSGGGKVRERLAVRKQAAQKFDGEKFDLRKLDDLEVRKQYRIEITHWFAALENVSDDEAMNVGPCRHGMVRPWVADGGTASDMEGSCE
jgi:hypothetical protein